MYRLIHVDADGNRSEQAGTALHDVDLAPIRTPVHNGWVWLDVDDPSDGEIRDLAEAFALDRVSRDDLFESQFPKFEALDDHEILVLHALAPDAAEVRTVEVDVVYAASWVLTVRRERVASIDHVADRMVNARFAADDPFHLVCRLAEFVGERYLPILDDLDAQILDLEDDAVEGDPNVLPEIHALRRDVALLRRVLGPQRRTLELLCRTGEFHQSERAERDLADALDHHVRLVESLESAHQMVATVLDTYRGAAAERMNEVMKVLTVFSAIFMPLTLIAGIYGMNFENMPELQRPYAYGATLVVMGVIAVSLWVYFVRRGFIGGPTVRDLARPAKAAGRVGRGLASAASLPLRATTKVFAPDNDR